ncbi:MAG: MgtC/SapB family protein, partial [Sphingobacteriales bacterium]
DFVWPVVGSIIAGGLIGFERQYRGSPAGFRTHILVALASGLLMLAAVHQIRWLSDTPQDIIRIDPVRMAHGILTGIGFLGAGVIFKDGFTVRGLTTAASLWITSALGTLYGVGFYGLAVGGTVATVAVLAAVTITEQALPQKSHFELSARFLRSAGVDESQFRAMLAAHGLKPSFVLGELEEEQATFTATIELRGPLNTEPLRKAIAADVSVRALRITPKA